MVGSRESRGKTYLHPSNCPYNWYTTWKHPDAISGPELQEEDAVESSPTCSLDYDALSYVWDSPDNPVTVFVRPPTETTDALLTLRIQRNLAVALRALRYHDKPRTLWVDALCINQYDTNERDVQITRMADIYSLAPRVVNAADHVPIPNLPSWVPNFNIPFQKITQAGSFAAATTKGDAVLHRRRDSLEAPSILEVSAMKIAGVVRSVEGPAASEEVEQISGRALNWVHAAQSLYDGDHSCYPTGEPLVDALCLTLCQNMVDSRLPVDSLSTEFLTWKTDFINFIRDPSNQTLQQRIMDLADNKHFRDHALITTDLGYFGIAHTATQVGDVICVIFGRLSPIILRPLPTENMFQVVGSCYIHGLSDGEAILGPVPAPWKAVLRAAADDGTNSYGVRFQNTVTGE